MSEPKVAKDVAAQEFYRFTEAMDIDTETALMDEDDQKGFESNKRKIVSAIMKGSLVINDDGEPVFTDKTEKVLTFHEPTGASYKAMDRSKANENFDKMQGLMGAITKTNKAHFASMVASDLKVCTAITTLFMV